MHSALLKSFEAYLSHDAPFMHQQLADWRQSRPLSGLRILHHVPVVANTLLKIACLVEAGADVTVTNPSSFCQAQPNAIACLQEAGIPYVDDLNTLKGELFDLYFDCGAELYQALGAPKIGAIELTGSGDHYYRQQSQLDCPVVSIDKTLTKQLETVFGSAESVHQAIEQLTGLNPTSKSWLIFGFGKIGRGLAYFCTQHQIPVCVVDVSEQQRHSAKQLGLSAINPQDLASLEAAIKTSDIIITATGKKAVLADYPRAWFHHKILANMGVYDEFGSAFTDEDVLNRKQAVNFVLNDPTPMRYIDPEFYLHNMAALFFLEHSLPNGVTDIPTQLDQTIIEQWCRYHAYSKETIHAWFLSQAQFNQ